VTSIVGRYLEHSRIFEFSNGNGPGIAAYYIGSADWMPRNLDRRVEAIVAVDDAAAQERLREILEVDLADEVLAWTLNGDGQWVKVPTTPGHEPLDTHLRLQMLASAREVRADR